MRIPSWNCRGLGKSFAVLQVQKIAQDFNPDVMYLMETCLASNKGKDIWNKCGFYFILFYFIYMAVRFLDWV